MSNIIQLNEEAIKNQLSVLVKNTVEETLNDLLDQEADRLTNAARYERNEARKDTRAGYYNRKLLTKAGEVNLKVPKLRHLPFETAIVERYKRRESSIEEALIEMYLLVYQYAGLKTLPKLSGAVKSHLEPSAR